MGLQALERAERGPRLAAAAATARTDGGRQGRGGAGLRLAGAAGLARAMWHSLAACEGAGGPAWPALGSDFRRGDVAHNSAQRCAAFECAPGPSCCSRGRAHVPQQGGQGASCCSGQPASRASQAARAQCGCREHLHVFVGDHRWCRMRGGACTRGPVGGPGAVRRRCALSRTTGGWKRATSMLLLAGARPVRARREGMVSSPTQCA